MKTKDYNSVAWNEVFIEDHTSPTGLCWKISPAQCAKAGAVAQWCNLYGERESKYFSCKKLGKELAFQMACEYREQMLDSLNESGAGYSERHGI